MAKKSRFTIPTLDEMEDAPSVSFKAKDLMAAQKESVKEQPKPSGSGDTSSGPKKPAVISNKLSQPISGIKQLGDSTSQAPTASKSPPVNPPPSQPSVKPKPPPPWKKAENSPSKPGTSRVTPATSKPTMMYKPVNVIGKKDGTETIPTGSGATGSPTKSGKTSILVSPRQRGNPILKFVRNVPWEFDDIVPDYQLGRTTCALFLSLRYHQLNPDYVHERLKKLGHSYDLRILLTHIDVKDPHHSLKELAKVCILSDCTLMVAFSPEEAGRYLETYKSFENKPPDLIMEKTEGTFLSKFTDSITSVKKVNKTDAMTLLSTFGTFEKIVNASEEDLSLCSGFGPQKAQQLHKVLNEPFLKPNKRKVPSNNDGDNKEKSPTKSPKKAAS